MKTHVLRTSLVLLLTIWTMVACGGGGSALGVGGSSSSSTVSAVVGEENPITNPVTAQDSTTTPEVGGCFSGSSGFIESETGPAFTIDYGAKILTEFLGAELDPNENLGKKFPFDLKPDQDPISCIFTAQIDGGASDFKVVDEKIRWLP